MSPVGDARDREGERDEGRTRGFPGRPIVGVGAVIFDGDCVLLVQRAHEPLKGHWSLPGGSVDLGETLRAAVLREVLEETGLQVEVGPVVDVVERVQHAADGRIEYHFIIIDYRCVRSGGSLVAGSDAADARWVPVSELSRWGVTQAATAVIEKAFGMSPETCSRSTSSTR